MYLCPVNVDTHVPVDVSQIFTVDKKKESIKKIGIGLSKKKSHQNECPVNVDTH